MQEINAREVMYLPHSEVMKMGRERIRLVLDDCTIETTTPRLIYSHMLWDIHRMFPSTPLLRSHFVPDGSATADTAITPLGHSCESCLDAHPDLSWQEIEHLWVLISNMTNDAYNFVVQHCGAYVHTKTILDIMDVIEDTEIAEIRNSLSSRYKIEHPDPIGSVNGEILDIIQKAPRFTWNQYVRTVNSFTVKTNQALQLVGIVGNKTDHDNLIFDYPVAGNFTQGMRNLTELGMESCSAKVALLASKKGLPDTEYANRRLQLSCSIIATVHRGDCGSQDYLDWKVEAGTFKGLLGKYFLDPTTSQIVAIKKHHKKRLVGKWVKLRTVFGCAHPDKHGVCSKCLGDMAMTVPYGTNLGQVAATQLGEQVTQGVLSIKHLVSSATALAIALGRSELKVFKTSKREPHIKMADAITPSQLTFTFNASEVANIADTRHVKSVYELPISRVTQITKVEVCVTKPDGGVTTKLMTVATPDRAASMSHDFLNYIKEHWYVTKSTNAITVDMTHWDKTKPLFELPKKHLSMINYMASVIAMIASSDSKGSSTGITGRELKRLTDFDTPQEALAEFHDLISAKLSVNLAYLEVIVQAMRVSNPAAGDFDTPERGYVGEIAKYNDVLQHRDLAGQMAYEGHQKVLVSPSAYVIKKRPGHILGAVFMPK